MRLRASGDRIVNCQSRCGSSLTSSSNSSRLTPSIPRCISNEWAAVDSIRFGLARIRVVRRGSAAGRWAAPPVPPLTDRWTDAAQYEAYVGRWSRPVARRFVCWLAVPPRRTWLDFGRGSGALTQAVLAEADPRAVLACDRAARCVAHLRKHTSDRRATFHVLKLEGLGRVTRVDVMVSGLVLNFLPDPAAALEIFRTVTKPGGTVACYVWDYAHGMQFLRAFWDTAAELDPSAAQLDEAVRFPICRLEPLRRLFQDVGLQDVAGTELIVPTVFADFDDLWEPFLGGQWPAPSYVQGLSLEHRNALRERLMQRLAPRGGGPIALTARAWAMRGIAA